jgi:hypothetical protein
MLARGVPFRELGGAFLDPAARDRTAEQFVRQLGDLGFEVVAHPWAA